MTSRSRKYFKNKLNLGNASLGDKNLIRNKELVDGKWVIKVETKNGFSWSYNDPYR
jgi:nitrogen fixation protein FixH